MSQSETAATPVSVPGHDEMDDPQLILYARDLKRAVDEERKKSRELAAANARLEVLDRLKSDFLTFISHELRTPLNALSAVDLIGPEVTAAEQAESLEIIRHGYARLQDFIEKGLEYFWWISQDQTPPSETADLAAVLRRAVQETSGLTEPGVAFRLVAPVEPCEIQGEAVYMVKVVKILLENAVKFSPQKKVIQAELLSTAGKVLLTVKDQGLGIDPSLTEEIFRPFTVADVKHHARGSGLNLALARGIVEAYGGKVRAESKGPGLGSSFTLEFPAASAANTGRSAAGT